MPTAANSASRFLRIPYAVADALPTMSKSALATYVALTRHADWQRRTCRASYPTLAEWAGLDRKTVASAIRELERLGFISWTKGNKGRSNLYCLPLEPVPMAGTTQQLGLPSERDGVGPADGTTPVPIAGTRNKRRILYESSKWSGESERQAKLDAFYSQTVRLD